MQALKKLDIIIDSLEMPKVLAILDKNGVSGYTLIDDVKGKGNRGIKDGVEITDVFVNSYCITACQAEKVDAIVAAIRPLLKRAGGVCLVSDAQWVTH